MKEISYYGKFYGDRTYLLRSDIFMWKEEMDLLRGLESDITSLSPGDKVFFTNHVNYPRFKFREWAKSNDISISYTPSKASVFVVNTNLIKKLIKHNSPEQIRKEHIDYFIMNPGGHLHKEIKDEIVYFDHSCSDEPLSKKYVVASLYRMSLNKGDIAALMQMQVLMDTISKGHQAKIIEYEDFHKQVSSNLVMDKETFWELLRMIQSDDRETSNLGVEMLTNFNFYESRFFIDMIYLFCTKTIRESTVFSTVNFKFLADHFKKSFSHIYANNRKIHAVNDLKSMLKNLINIYEKQKLMDCIRTDLIRDIYYTVIENMKGSTDNYNFYALTELWGIKIEDVTISLDPAIFPSQNRYFTNFENNEQEKPTSGSELGEDLHELTEDYLPESDDSEE